MSPESPIHHRELNIQLMCLKENERLLKRVPVVKQQRQLEIVQRRKFNCPIYDWKRNQVLTVVPCKFLCYYRSVTQ